MKKQLLAITAVVALATAATVAVVSPASAVNTAYYVNNQAGSSCSDSGPGSITQPWCTFGPINSHGAFGAGDSIQLARGATWNQQMNLTGSGTAASPISVTAYGSGANPKIQRNDSVDDRGIKVVDGDYWSFSNLEISHAASGLLAYYDTVGHNGLSISNVYVHDIKGIIFYTNGSSSTHVASADADNVRNSSGIQITGKYTTFSSTDYFIRGVRIDMVTGDHNFDTVGIDMLGPESEQVQSNVGGSGGAGANMVQNVVIDHLASHDDNWGCDEALRLFTVEHAVVMNSNFNNEAPCFNASGTTAVILGHLDDVSVVNSVFSNVLDTGSNDEDALDFEIFNNNVRARNSLFENTAGSAMSFLKLGGRTGDYSTNNESSSNVFVNNGVAKGYAPLLVLNGAGGASIGGVLRDNINVNSNLYYDQGFGFGGFSTVNNQTLSNGSGNTYFAAADFSGVQGQNGWSYQTFNGSTYSNLVYDSTAQKWTPSGQSVPEITQFDQHPDTTTGWVARAWTAPSTGTVSLRGRILKSDNAGGGNGILARITKNGTQVWPSTGTQLVAAGDEYSGVGYALDGISVNAGDVIRFETNNNGDSSYDKASWTPSVTYTSNLTQAYNWGFNGGQEAGWTVFGATTSTATGTDLNSLNITSTGGDPRAFSPDNLGVNASAVPTVSVRMNNSTTDTSGKIYFDTTADPSFSESKSVAFTVAASSGYATYNINMASNSLWAGTIRQIRVDPITVAGATSIDSVALIGSGALYTDRLIDGGFEDPSADFYTYNPAGVWVYTGTAGVQRNLSAFSGSQGAPQGQQTAFVQGTGSAKQTLNMSAGSHTVSFSAARRTNNGGVQQLDFYVDGTKINSTSFAPSSGTFQSFTTPSFTTTAGSHVLEFRGVNAGDNTAFVDSVTLQ